ncbi:MAG: site-specific DNA-methyltransferase, partial [Gammaproteobacteria bacterium]
MTELHFKGKEFVRNHHLSVPHRPLVPDVQKSVGEARLDGNLIIHGDNLHALKSLLPIYAGRVNCIYIDPPYNTGNENWCYNDNVNSPQMQQWLSQNPVGLEDGLRHDKWCCMMWPRLVLLRELLAEDGVIFISIDDNEQHRLRLMMDEIFGAQNAIANIIWEKRYAPTNDAKYFSSNHDFVICYVKTHLRNSANGWGRNLLPRTEKQNKPYKYDDQDGKGRWRSDNLSVKSYSAAYDYPIVNPVTKQEHLPPVTCCWRTSREKMQQWMDEGRIYWGAEGTGAPQLKRYLNEVQPGIVPMTIWTHEKVGHTDGARKMLKEVFADAAEVFDNPKPLGLLDRILQVGADKNAI